MMVMVMVMVVVVVVVKILHFCDSYNQNQPLPICQHALRFIVDNTARASLCLQSFGAFWAAHVS
jgi:hypothetical protein